MENQPKLVIKKDVHLLSYVLLVSLIIVVGFACFYLGLKRGVRKGEQVMMIQYEKAIKNNSVIIPGITDSSKEILSISGKITAINDKVLSVEAAKPAASVLELGQKITYKVTVKDDTKIEQMSNPLEFLSTVNNNTNQLTLPTIPKNKTLNFSDLKVNQSVTASASTNIRNKTSFEATTIVVSQ